MAVPSNTFQTYQAKGIREDLGNVIFRVSPTDTPFTSMIKKEKCQSTKYEWQTDDLASAAANAAIEGDDPTTAAASATTRWDNYTQISQKTFIVSGTQEVVNKAGRESEVAFQTIKRGEELKRDMEFALTQNTTYNAGNASTARQLRGLEGWVYTNDSLGASGVSPVPASNTAPTDGTQRAITEPLLKTVIQLCWDAGGNPNIVMCGSAQKQAISGFSGNVTRFNESDANKLYTAFDFYVSDFGTLKIVANRFQRARTAFVLQSDMWKLRTLRPMKRTELAKTGDSMRYQMLTEYTLESCNEQASGAVRDLS